MTTAELEAEADRLAALRSDPRTPAVVRRAFLRPGALTLRKFLALEDAASPVLDGRWPAEDPAAMADAFCTAFAIVFPGEPVPPPAELSRAIERMVGEVRRAFSTVMPMRWPRQHGADPAPPREDGLGWIARFIARFPYPPDQVLDTPLDQLFILAAAQNANEGADCAGEDYRERDGGNLKAETGNLKEEGSVQGVAKEREADSDTHQQQSDDAGEHGNNIA